MFAAQLNSIIEAFSASIYKALLIFSINLCFIARRAACGGSTNESSHQRNGRESAVKFLSDVGVCLLCITPHQRKISRHACEGDKEVFCFE